MEKKNNENILFLFLSGADAQRILFKDKEERKPKQCDASCHPFLLGGGQGHTFIRMSHTFISSIFSNRVKPHPAGK